MSGIKHKKNMQPGYFDALNTYICDGLLYSISKNQSLGLFSSYGFDFELKMEEYIKGVELNDNDKERVCNCISTIREFRFSRFNESKFSLECDADKPKIIVIDQIKDDPSIKNSCAKNELFIEMLEFALNAHPEDTIWVRIHPEVMHGNKEEFLFPLPFEHPNLKLYTQYGLNSWDFLDSAVHVYTVSSLIGFEAIIAGAQVYCFGRPFYAGWGLTKDRERCSQRGMEKTLVEVFYAAYMHHSDYIDPVLKSSCGIEEVIAYISLVFHNMDVLPKKVSMKTLSIWKRFWLKDFLDAWRVTPSSVAAHIQWGRAEKINEDGFCIEDGFIRSVGLGVHLNRPISLVCDKEGIYFDARFPSDLEHLLNTVKISHYEESRARELINKLLVNKITKYNVGETVEIPSLRDNRVILVPGQVESDASIKFGSPNIYKNSDLLTTVRKDNPDAYIIYKPHPDVVAGERDDGNWNKDYINLANHVEIKASMSQLLDLVDEVHTLTSLTGFEALLRNKKVVTYGLPFYSGWGLTSDKMTCERRKVNHCLESLVFICLVLYPTYIDPITRELITVEQAITRINHMKKGDLKTNGLILKSLIVIKKTMKKLASILEGK